MSDTSDELSLAIPDRLISHVARTVADILSERIQLTGQRGEEVESSRRLALTKTEAADALGISVDHLDRHVIPDLRVVRSGRLRLIPVAELQRWLDENAARLLGP